MDSYTITITPNDDCGNSTTLTVDTSTGPARITSVHMHAPAGLTGAQMPSVDVELLLQAVTGPTHSAAAITTASTPAAETATQLPTTTGAGIDELPAADTTVTPPAPIGDTPQPSTPAAATARRTSRRAAAAARTTESAKTRSSGARRGRNQPSPKPAAPRKAAPRKAAPQPTAAAADGGAERVYRKMPVDFAAVYRQAGTAAAVADHYGVPRYTAQGWIGRHKKQDAAARN